MPNRLAIFKVSAAPSIPPAPLAQVRMIRSEMLHSFPAVQTFGLSALGFIRSEIIHSMPAVETFGLNSISFIRSCIIHSMPIKNLLSWVGQVTPANPLPESIASEVSHAF